MTLQVDVAHSSIPRSTVSCIHYHKKYSRSYLGISTQLFIPPPPSIQAKHSPPSRAEGFNSEPLWKTGGKHSKEMRLLERKTETPRRQRKLGCLFVAKPFPHHEPMSATDLFSVPAVLPFLESQINTMLKGITF